LPQDGFVFVSRDNGSEQPCLISVPKQLLRTACDAVISNRDVFITHYRELVSRGNTVPPTRLLEIHLGGMEIASRNSQEKNTDAPHRFSSQHIWTLTQWWRKETADSSWAATAAAAATPAKQSSSRTGINLVATVDAVSPILALDPDTPFALAEIYDRDNTDVTGVVVMHGKAALVAHAAVFASDTLVFRNLVYKAWSIPNMIQEEATHLIGRVPSYVFVATEIDWVVWDHPILSENSTVETSLAIPPAITPVNLIARIQGTIQHVQTTNVCSTKGNYTCIQYIDLILKSQTDCAEKPAEPTVKQHSCCRLYLAHFSMSTTLQMSLRRGAVVEANNIHKVLALSGACCSEYDRIQGEQTMPALVFGTCLRSSVILVTSASNHMDTLNQKDSTMITALPSIQFPWQGHSFCRRIKETYKQMYYHEQVIRWASQNFRSSSHTLPVKWIIKTLMTNCSYRNGDQVGGHFSYKNSTRSPYAEFFDHPFSLSDFETHPSGQSCGCTLSKEDRFECDFNAACLIGLDEIRQTSQTYIIERIRRRLLEASAVPINTGWSGSVFVRPEDLFLGKGINHDDAGNDWYIGGYVSEVGSFSKRGAVVGIQDGACRLPVSDSHEEGAVFGINAFVLGQVESFSISCLCLGSATTRDQELPDDSEERGQKNEIVASVSLPILAKAKDDLLGGCSLTVISGQLFIACIQIHCSKIIAAGRTAPKQEESDAFVSIEECLQTASGCESQFQDMVAQGLMTHRCFRHKLQSDGSHKCCELKVSCIPKIENREGSLDTSCLQNIDVSICLKQNTAMILKLTERLSLVCQSASVSDSQKNIAACFWSLGDSGNTCVLTIGGTENLVLGSTYRTTGAHVHFPVSAIERTPLGFVQICCMHSDLSAHLCNLGIKGTAKRRVLCPNVSPDFDFESTPKIPKGLLQRRLRRRHVINTNKRIDRVIGEMIATPSDAIPCVSLSQLFDRMCKFLRDTDSVNLYPSVVQCISSATLIGISFCQVQTYCTKCFSRLVDMNQRGGRAASSLLEETDEPSFWHLPDPKGMQRADLKPEQKPLSNNLKFDYEEDIQRSSLQCPNRCLAHCYRAKWECSGTVDDGTGQATLYADGDAALTLLGMSEDVIQWIERGIWCFPGGVLTFKKSLPPSKQLREAVRNILILKVSTAEQTRLLSQPLRAEYLLHTHCRSSTQPQRPLDYYVRCKPLPDKMRHLHHTTLDSCFASDTSDKASIFHGEVSSYSLPSLKLQLVDCSVPLSYAY
jgi:hypothetical protein